MHVARLSFVLTVLFLGGCLENAEEQDRLMKEDPAFKQMIGARDEARRQIQTIRQDMLAKKNTLDATLGKLRSDYDAYAKAQTQKIAQFRQTIDANREILKKELDTAAASLEQKLAEMAGHQRTLADVKKMLTESRAGKSITLSKSERQKWEERVLMLSEKIRPLAEEIQDLRLEIRLKRHKIGYLR